MRIRMSSGLGTGPGTIISCRRSPNIDGWDEVAGGEGAGLSVQCSAVQCIVLYKQDWRRGDSIDG